jgi:hypothetical protein
VDCPTGYLWLYDREIRGFDVTPILLGTLSVRIEGRPSPGGRCVVTSWHTGKERRRLVAEGALFGEEENLLAVGRAVWIIVDRQVQVGRTWGAAALGDFNLATFRLLVRPAKMPSCAEGSPVRRREFSL